MNRRTFVIATLASGWSARRGFARPFAENIHPVATPVLRVALLATGASARDRHDGATLGIEEAQHAAQLFGGGAELITLRSPDERIPTPVAAILGNASRDASRALARRSANGGPLFMNVSCTADDLRGVDCGRSAFHVAPSDAMMRAARALVPAASAVVVWHSSLARFGADTLNQRFAKRFGRPMTADAWTSWFAVKVLWESTLRMKSVDPAQLADYLMRDTTQFDGHKGKPLSFRAWDHQLRQFLYARAGGGAVTDVPQTTNRDATARDILDQLGARASTTTCRFT